MIPNITVSAAVISLGERLAMGACRSGLQMWKASAACSGTEDTGKRHPAQVTQPTESNTVRHCPWDGTIAMVNVTSLCTTQPSAHAAAAVEVGGPLEADRGRRSWPPIARRLSSIHSGRRSCRAARRKRCCGCRRSTASRWRRSFAARSRVPANRTG